MKKHAKALAQVAAAALAALVAVLADSQVSVGEWINVAISVTTAAAVFTAPNIPQHKTIKSVLAVLGAMLALAPPEKRASAECVAAAPSAPS